MKTYRIDQLHWTLQPSFQGYPELRAGFSPDRLTSGWATILPQLLGTADFAGALNEYEAQYTDSKTASIRRDHNDAAANRALRSQAEAEGTPCYVRFGKLPKSGYSVNHRDGVAEPGVSVYRAYKLGTRYVIDLAGTDSGSGMFIIGKAQMHQVTGDLAGTGSDGEPCLTNCKARKVNAEFEVIF